MTGGEDYPPLSALNDLLYCERRCYLHRVEGVWVENVHTLTGSQDHRRVHTAGTQESASGRVGRGLRLVSHRLRVQGVADLVEWVDGVPLPVEYKRGKRRRWDNDDVQLCAQAICLEEMMQVSIPQGAIFHIRSKRRREVIFTTALRERTQQAADRLHQILQWRQAPAVQLHPKCQECSLYHLCLPELLAEPRVYERAARTLFSIDD